MRDMLTTRQVCKMLGVDPRTLRKYETPDGKWCTIYGFRLRVYRLGNEPTSQRRYYREEVERLVEQIRKGGK